MPHVVGVFDRPDHVAEAASRLRGRGFEDLETYSPAPFPEIDDAVIEKPSRVRLFTLIGGLTGVVTGYALTIWMSYDWPIKIGGKPYASIPPYTIIAFELTILFGGLLTALGLFLIGGLPKPKRDAAYDARFSADDFGVAVSCRDRDVAEVDGLLRSHGATEVNLVSDS